VWIFEGCRSDARTMKPEGRTPDLFVAKCIVNTHIFCKFVAEKSDSMYFDNYKSHRNSKLRPSLLWEYDVTKFDWNAMRIVVLQRVIERGRLDDFYAALNLYGKKAFMEGLKEIPSLSDKDINFVHVIFGIKKEELKCYRNKQSRRQHWNS